MQKDHLESCKFQWINFGYSCDGWKMSYLILVTPSSNVEL